MERVPRSQYLGAGTPLKRAWSARTSKEVTMFLESVPVPTQGNGLLEVLEDLGVDRVYAPADLQLITEEDLKDSGT